MCFKNPKALDLQDNELHTEFGQQCIKGEIIL